MFSLGISLCKAIRAIHHVLRHVPGVPVWNSTLRGWAIHGLTMSNLESWWQDIEVNSFLLSKKPQLHGILGSSCEVVDVQRPRLKVPTAQMAYPTAERSAMEALETVKLFFLYFFFFFLFLSGDLILWTVLPSPCFWLEYRIEGIVYRWKNALNFI